jgi:hypothetical protein
LILVLFSNGTNSKLPKVVAAGNPDIAGNQIHLLQPIVADVPIDHENRVERSGSYTQDTSAVEPSDTRARSELNLLRHGYFGRAVTGHLWKPQRQLPSIIPAPRVSDTICSAHKHMKQSCRYLRRLPRTGAGDHYRHFSHQLIANSELPMVIRTPCENLPFVICIIAHGQAKEEACGDIRAFVAIISEPRDHERLLAASQVEWLAELQILIPAPRKDIAIASHSKSMVPLRRNLAKLRWHGYVLPIETLAESPKASDRCRICPLQQVPCSQLPEGIHTPAVQLPGSIIGV